jgi:hypothetical protein
MAAKKTTSKTSARKPPAAAPKKPAAAKPAAAKPPAAKKPAPAPAAPAPKKPAAAPKKPAKTAGIAFKSPGFRLTVINELLDLGHFADEFEAAQENADEVEEYEIDPRVQTFVDSLALTEELLEQVVKIGPDGGDEIYAGLVPEWDGEDDRFDIDTLEDLRLLPNLERVSLYCMVSEGLDLTPLRDVATLTHVNINLSNSWVKNWTVLDELTARGVEVTRA